MKGYNRMIILSQIFLYLDKVVIVFIKIQALKCRGYLYRVGSFFIIWNCRFTIYSQGAINKRVERDDRRA
jgi:hypothetical protein